MNTPDIMTRYSMRPDPVLQAAIDESHRNLNDMIARNRPVDWDTVAVDQNRIVEAALRAGYLMALRDVRNMVDQRSSDIELSRS